MVQNLNSYNDQSTYMLHKSQALVYVKSVRSLNLIPTSDDMTTVATDYNFDKDKTTLAALLVKVNTNFYIKIISITLSDKTTRVRFVKEFLFPTENDVLNNSYTLNHFNFSYMKDETGIGLGPTVTLSLCATKPCEVDVLTRIQDVLPLQITSDFNPFPAVDYNVVNIIGSKTSEDFLAIYFFGHYADNGDRSDRYPIMYKVKLL